MPQRFLTCLSVSIAAAFGSGSVSALGFGRAVPAATLGAPLDFSVGLRLDNGELVPENCISAEVLAGDVALPRSTIFTSLEAAGSGATVRVRTSVRMEEPVLTVTVVAGCEAKITRKFTLFADPPGLSTGIPLVVPPEVAAAAPEPVVQSAALAPKSGNAAPAAPMPRTQKVVPRPAKPRPAAPSADSDIPAGPSVVRAAAVPVEVAKSAEPKAAAPKAAARLRLDAPSVTFAADKAAEAAWLQREELLAVVRAATNVAEVAANSASTRVAAMEASVETLKRESTAQREAMKRLQASLAEADERGQWTPWLLAAVLALLAAAGWLYARLRRVEAAKQADWWSAPVAPPVDAPADPALRAEVDTQRETAAPAAAPAVPSAVAPAAVPAVPPLPPIVTPNVGSGADAERRPGTMTQHTQPLPAGFVVPDNTPARDVSIEELLDIEQQAEFFIVLGQDDAAVDLLMGHLRSTGGTSPLPYLKLLEIYHRRGDQAAYERVRKRFNERFNAVAPDWASDLNAGRSLEDYADLMAQIERSWPRPVDAMADLETLLFRTDGRELFDLPAYRDVLFLFTLARDVQESLQHEAPQVDVLLPLFRVERAEERVDSVPSPLEASVPGELRLTLVERAPAVAPVVVPVAPAMSEPAAASDLGFLKDSPIQRA